MSNYPRSPILLKGALVEFSSRFISAVPNVIMFQYNPETMTRTLEAHEIAVESTGDATDKTKPAPTIQPGDPIESFSLVLEFDATDALENPIAHPVALMSGVADRIAAVELLLYPQEDSLIGGLLGTISKALGGAASASGGTKAKPVPRNTVPIVLFVWGPGRILPVRVATFSVEEQAYSPLLFPIRAKVSIGLKVLQPDDIDKMKAPNDTSKKIAKYAYTYMKKQKQVLGMANVANTVESILGIIGVV